MQEKGNLEAMESHSGEKSVNSLWASCICMGKATKSK